MAKDDVDINQVEELERLADDILRNIRDIRYGMSNEGLKTLPLQTATALIHLNWLQGWSNKSLAVFKTEVGRKEARLMREKLKKERGEHG